MTKMNEMKLLVGSDIATITKEFWNPLLSGGGDWEITWVYSVKRIEPITFADSFQVDTQDYTAIFYIVAY